MNQHAELIARLRTDSIFDNSTLGNEAADAVEQASAKADIYYRQKQELRNTVDKLYRLFGGIHALLYPAPISLETGQTMVFRPKDPDPHEVMQELSDRIRALPDALERLPAGDVTLPSATITISGDGQPFAGNWYDINRLKDYGARCAAAAVLAERERCAAISESWADYYGVPIGSIGPRIAKAIRKGTS